MEPSPLPMESCKFLPLRDIKSGFFSIPHLLWHGTSVFRSSPMKFTSVAESLTSELSQSVLSTYSVAKGGSNPPIFRMRTLYQLSHRMSLLSFAKLKCQWDIKLVSKEENLNLCSNLNIYSYIKLSSPAKSWESIYLYTVNDLYVNVNSVKQGFRVKRRGNGALKPQWGFAFYRVFPVLHWRVYSHLN